MSSKSSFVFLFGYHTVRVATLGTLGTHTHQHKETPPHLNGGPAPRRTRAQRYDANLGNGVGEQYSIRYRMVAIGAIRSARAHIQTYVEALQSELGVEAKRRLRWAR